MDDKNGIVIIKEKAGPGFNFEREKRKKKGERIFLVKVLIY